MVKEIYSWKCPNCGEEYHSEYEAYDCQETCREKKDALEGPTLFICEMCTKNYRYNSKAESCEEDHKDRDDLYYNAWLDREEKKKLEEAANHINQEKLIGDKWNGK